MQVIKYLLADLLATPLFYFTIFPSPLYCTRVAPIHNNERRIRRIILVITSVSRPIGSYSNSLPQWSDRLQYHHVAAELSIVLVGVRIMHAVGRYMKSGY